MFWPNGGKGYGVCSPLWHNRIGGNKFAPVLFVIDVTDITPFGVRMSKYVYLYASKYGPKVGFFNLQLFVCGQ